MSVKKMYVNSAKNRVTEVHTMKNGVKKSLYRFKNKFIENGILKPDSNIVIYSMGGSSSLDYKNLLASYDDMLESGEITSADGIMTINKTLPAVPAAVFIYNEYFVMEAAEFGTKTMIVGAMPLIIEDVVTNMNIYSDFTIKFAYDAISSFIINGEESTETEHIEIDLNSYYIKKRKLLINGIEKEVCGVEIMIPGATTTGAMSTANHEIIITIGNLYTF